MHISGDGRFFWDGSMWKPLYSPDGRHRWDGAQWVPTQAAQPDRPSWLPAGAQPAVRRSAPVPAVAPATPQIKSYIRPIVAARPVPSLAESLLFSRLPALGGVAVFLIAAIALGVLAVGKIRAPEQITPVLLANDVRLSYNVGVVERWHDHESDHGVITLPNGQKLESRSDADATFALRVISVAPDGAFTLGFKYESLTGFDNGQPIFFNPQKAREIILVIRPDGSIVSGGTNGTAGGKPTESVPGGDQNWSILPDRDVKAGDEWGKSFDRPNPLGPGIMHYSVRSKFVRYDDIFGVKAAVVETRYSLPIDLTLDLHALLALYGDDGADFPAGVSVAYRGKCDGLLITSVDIHKHGVIKALVTDDADFDVTFQGLPDTPKFAPLKGKFHYAGRDVGDMERLS
jgi:hypothetical protein